MATKNTNHSVTVGIFISVGVLLLVGAIFLLGGQQKTFVKTITIKAVFDDINGLQPGNNIWLFGVKVGTVKKINFYGQSKVEIIMNLEKIAQSRVHKDATAKIGSDGLIGNKIIVLNGGTPTFPQLEEGDYVGVAVNAGTEQMLAILQENNKNLLEITKNLKTVSKKMVDGEGSIGKLLNDPTMANDLKAAIAHFKNVATKSETVIANVQQFAEGLHKKGSIANELVSDTVVFSTIRTTVANLKEASANLNNASQKVTVFADSLQQINTSLSNPKKPIGLLLNDYEVARNLKGMIQNLESGSKKLDDDLEAVQHNFLLRGFFKRKEKALQKM